MWSIAHCAILRFLSLILLLFHLVLGSMDEGRELQFKQETSMLSIGNTDNDPNLLMFHFNDIVVATNNFSFENKLGQGGYGPVYKVRFVFWII